MFYCIHRNALHDKLCTSGKPDIQLRIFSGTSLERTLKTLTIPVTDVPRNHTIRTD